MAEQYYIEKMSRKHSTKFIFMSIINSILNYLSGALLSIALACIVGFVIFNI